ncbi:hypothetical protein [Thalassoroseus pseudoceratinae]|uniref:hypothetical protein n=1 Tax=Thalassoroseus pseudoceratinae TaxID=2713176 RepID=UPI00142381E5|nr:hypothetical protein [Thalassoroseus pseudoceratinae]
MLQPLNDIDENRFQTILRETHLAVRSYLAGLGVPTAAVDEFAMRSYTELYRSFRRMPVDASPEFWVKGIAKNLVRESLSKSPQRLALSESLEASLSMLQQSAVAADFDSKLTQCIEKLPDDRRSLLESRYEVDTSATRLAGIVGQTAAAVRETLFRIRVGLKDCVTRGADHDS